MPLLAALLSVPPGKRGLSVRAGAAVAYLSGVLWYFGDCSWIYQTMYLYGGLAKPVAVLILFLFSFYLGLYHAIFGGLVIALSKIVGRSAALLLAPFAWVGVELMRSRLTSFPWDLLGNAMVDNHMLVQLAPIAGVMGISFVVALSNACLASLWISRSRWRWLLAGGAAAFVCTIELGAGVAGKVPTADQTAVLVQENLAVGVMAKGSAFLSPGQEIQRFSELSLYPERTYSLNKGTTVVVWPEAPSHLQSNEPDVLSGLQRLSVDAGAPMVVGLIGLDVDRSTTRGYSAYDSALVLDRSGKFLGRYDKIHLVPWGEYIPYKRFFAFASKLTEGAGDMDPGHLRSVFLLDGHPYGIFVCYESVFGDEVREFVKQGAEVLVNISDDGWYGDTGAPWQHLNMARMRAIENHRWVLRDTNTGETTTIDPQGNYTMTPRHVRTAYALPFGFERDVTFYTRYGDWFAFICAAVVALALIYGWALGR